MQTTDQTNKQTTTQLQRFFVGPIGLFEIWRFAILYFQFCLLRRLVVDQSTSVNPVLESWGGGPSVTDEPLSDEEGGPKFSCLGVSRKSIQSSMIMFGCLSPPMYILSASQSLTISVLVMLLQRTLLKADVSLNLVQSNSPMLQLENGKKKLFLVSIAYVHIWFCSVSPILWFKLMVCDVSPPDGPASCYIQQTRAKPGAANTYKHLRH